MTITIVDAKRESVPMLISIASVSGGGKTFSALLMAAGLAGPEGVVGLLDTENKRGKMYEDTTEIRQALPRGYKYAEMREPFTPSRYSEHVEAFEQKGCQVLIIDSATHEWEGYGGCADIAENNKMKGMPNWILAKREHKRMMNHLLASNMHIIFCLRAREKIKVVKDGNGKDQFLPIGLQPIQEKNFTFEMTLSLLLEEHTHKPLVTKCPKPLLHLFQGEQPLVTKAMGEKLRTWAEAASPQQADPEELARQAIAYAAQGTVSYQEFWKAITGKQQKELFPRHDEFKELARMADDRQKQVAEDAPLLPELQF